MKTQTLVLVGVGVLALVLISSKANASNSYNLDVLDDTYGDYNVSILNDLLNNLVNRGLSDQQIKFLLSQALVETGLFTDNPNYLSTNTRHNYAGISHGGSITYYNSISDFVDDWLNVLDKGTYPLQATSIADYNTRLKANGYYTDSATTYGNNLNYYYNLLSSI